MVVGEMVWDCQSVFGETQSLKHALMVDKSLITVISHIIPLGA